MLRKLLLLSLLVALPFSVTIAQGLVDSTNNNTIGFAGMRYDNGATMIAGGGQNVIRNLWAFGYGELTRGGGDMAAELAWIQPVAGSFSIGFLAGPGSNWLDTEGGSPPNYFYAAGGLMLTYKFGDAAGAAAWYKYKDDFDDDNAFEADGVFGAALWFDI